MASHLVYWYGIAAIRGVFWLVLGLVVADLLNQSILQSEALAASRAELLGEPGMSREVTEQLAEDQRMPLFWKVVVIEVAVFTPLWLTGLLVGYYRTWIMQNIEQDLRLALARSSHKPVSSPTRWSPSTPTTARGVCSRWSMRHRDSSLARWCCAARCVDGRDLRDYRVDSLRANIGVALQEDVLFRLSVRDNIRYAARDASDESVAEAVRVACVDDFVDGLPEGLDTVLGDRGGRLSAGQRQRLSIARAVVRDTPILVLDEPTSALDAETELRVLSNLAEWSAGHVGETGTRAGARAILLVTHRISTIRRADNILYLDGAGSWKAVATRP